ncbi:MAG TPA: hypothetical protein VFY71_11205 [Planctomycetota bacterium]|nr:hypothetical protein [Planctomycetota bacterium]
MILLAVLLAAVTAAPLQVHKPIELPQPQGDDVATKLVQRIQQDLAEVDKQLDQAAGEDKLGDEIKSAREAHVRAIAGLEDLIKQIKYRRSQNPSSSDGGGGGGQSQAQPRGADDRSQAESAQAPQPGGKEQQQQQQQKQGGAKPQGGQPDPTQGVQRDGQQPPPPSATEDFLRRDTDARWGVLPPKLQERLMNLHTDDIPERYRAWLEAYVRELNRRDTGSGP